MTTDDHTQLIEDIDSLTRKWKSEERRADHNLKSAHGWQENYNRVVRKQRETQRKLDEAERATLTIV